MRVCRYTKSRPTSEGHIMPAREARLNDLRGRSAGDPGPTANPASAIIGHHLGLHLAETMRRLRSRAVKSAMIAIPAMAVMLSAGGASAATTQNAGQLAAHASQHGKIAGHSASAYQMTATTLTWHKLALINGWTPSQSSIPTGKPGYAIKRGVVYLRGSLHQPAGANRVFAVLPKAARPARSLYITVVTSFDVPGTLLITPDGTMQAYHGNAQGFTSLAAISYPAATTTRHKLTLINGWKSDEGIFSTGDPSYSIIGGVIHLSGSLHQPSGTNPLFAVLPRAARPAHLLYVTIGTSTGVGTLRIEPNGDMVASGSPPADAQVFTSLAAVSYPRTS
jgi:hypothetical protein